MQRSQKQIVIAFLFVFFLVSVAFFFWRLFLFQAPSCRDGIQNRGEVGIDCGGECAPCEGIPQEIRLKSDAKFVKEGGTANAFFSLENVNLQWGAKTVSYQVSLEDEEGHILTQKDGITFLLPLQTRLVVEQGIAFSGPQEPTRARVKIGETEWVGIRDRIDNGLSVLKSTFSRPLQGPYAAEVRGLIRNDSPFIYDRIEVLVTVRDSDEEILGVRKTDMRTLGSGERREFVTLWRPPFSFKGDPKIDVFAFTNVFENENFVKIHGTVGRFQELY